MCAHRFTQELAAQLQAALNPATALIPNSKGMNDAYSLLSIVLPALWICMGQPMAPILSAAIIRAGGMPSLVRLARVSGYATLMLCHPCVHVT